ncbi:MAG: preprotein translocase subunit SecA [Myxococcales bacterium]|nr:preprotein translocase subunit SecA [Myxococcales bacterium]
MIPWLLQKVFGTKNERELKKIRPMVARINDLEPKMRERSDDELRALTAAYRQRIDNGENLDAMLFEAFATCREAGRRVMNMRHFDVQMIGGIALHRGMVAEMRTGEGKTLVATLPSYLNALEGKGVHVVTVNDYLATRDAEWMGRIHRFLGLEVGCVVGHQSDRAKKEAYTADITYGQNNEFGFDYLRDNMKTSVYDCAQRGLNFAIVDEVDSILIDEARTPLIISGPGDTATTLYAEITKIIPYLRKDEHYLVDEKAHSVSLTDEGIEEAERRLKIKNLYDPAHIEELHVLQQCLRAHTLFKRDVNYIVSDTGKVMIIDDFTGRVLEGRRWSDGLHQAVEAKEFVKVQEENRTMATITFQNLFRLYKKLGGMTGTAETEAEELHKTYKLDVLPIPTNRPVQRKDYDDLVYKTEREKFKAVVEEIAESVERGQPSLVGTVSVEKSEAIASLLRKRGIKHEVLNAKQHEREAYIVAQAGRKSAVTVATNMAGRGTDIILGGNPEMLARAEMLLAHKDPSAPENEAEFNDLVGKYKVRCDGEKAEVVEAGGLHIIGTERHESRRIDNQLRGRAGRQGDPGSSRFFLSLEDDLMRIFAGERVQGIMERLGMEEDVPIEHPWVTRSVENAQRKVEARNFDIRKNVLEYDDVMNQQRKSVYKQRREVLEGRYSRDVKAREEDVSGDIPALPLDEATVKRVGEVTEAMLRNFAVDPDNGGAPAAPAATLDEMKAFDADQVAIEVYHYFGAQVDLRKVSNTPVEAGAKLADDVKKSLQAQRERLFDLIDLVGVSDIEQFCPENATRDEWNVEALVSRFRERFGVEPAGLENIGGREELARALYHQAEALWLSKESEIESELLLRAFKSLTLEEIDRAWIDHLTNMDHLRDGIGLRGYGQRDPKLEFKKEGFEMFTAMMNSVNAGVLSKLFHMQFTTASDIERLEAAETQRAAERARQMSTSYRSEDKGLDEDPLAVLAALGLDAGSLQTVRRRGPTARNRGNGGGASLPPPAASVPPPAASSDTSGDTADAAAEAAAIASASESIAPPSDLQAVRRRQPKVGRNDPCPCGSGKKYKACHGAAGADALPDAAAEASETKPAE